MHFSRHGTEISNPKSLDTYTDAYAAALGGQDFAVLEGPRARLAREAYSEVHALLAKYGFVPVGEVLVGSRRRLDISGRKVSLGRLATVGAGIVGASALAISLVGTGAAQPTSANRLPHRTVAESGSQDVAILGETDGRIVDEEFTIEVGDRSPAVIRGATVGVGDTIRLPDGTYPIYALKGGPPQEDEPVVWSETDITISDQSNVIVVQVPDHREWKMGNSPNG